MFVTAYDQYAVEAFDRDAVDYLLKPVTDERLAKCVERLKRKLDAAEKPPGLDDVLARLARAIPGTAGAGKLRWVRALKGEVVHQIAVDDVLYFQAADKYTCVMTREGESLIRLPLAELAGQLDARRLLADPPQHHREHERSRLHAPRPRRAHVRHAEGRQDRARR